MQLWLKKCNVWWFWASVCTLKVKKWLFWDLVADGAYFVCDGQFVSMAKNLRHHLVTIIVQCSLVQWPWCDDCHVLFFVVFFVQFQVKFKCWKQIFHVLLLLDGVWKESIVRNLLIILTVIFKWFECWWITSKKMG